MKNYRFYAEMSAERGSKSASKKHLAFTRKLLQTTAARGGHVNCIAVPLENGQPMYQTPGFSQVRSATMDAFCPVDDRSNATIEGASVDAGYLRKRCVRVPAQLAALLHPKLMAYLK